MTVKEALQFLPFSLKSCFKRKLGKLQNTECRVDKILSAVVLKFNKNFKILIRKRKR